MQLGVRWRAGDPPHRSVPDVLHAEISRQEALHTDANSWTLTWLEGRPRATLDDLVTVAVDRDGRVVASEGPSPAIDGGTRFAEEDDDDDWLK